MRVIEKNTDEDLLGKVAVCSVGRVAIITGRKEFEFGFAWTGLGLDGKGTWASTTPCIVAESGHEFHEKLIERFNGKMSRNG
jgi:hypothetical protein